MSDEKPALGARYVKRGAPDKGRVVTVTRVWTADDGHTAVAYDWRDDRPGQCFSACPLDVFHRKYRAEGESANSIDPEVRAMSDTDRDTLRRLITDAVERVFEAWRQGLGDTRPQDAVTDAVLAVVRDAAIRLWHETNGLTEYGRGARWAIGELRRLAGETQQDEAACAHPHGQPGITSLLEHVGIDTSGGVTVDGRTVAAPCTCGGQPAREVQQDPTQDGEAVCLVAGCGHDEAAHTIAGCRECPRGWHAVHLFSLPAVARSGQPDTDEETLVHVGWWCWRGDNHGHLATMACRSDNVPIHVPAEWADDMRAVLQRIEDGDEPETDEEARRG